MVIVVIVQLKNNYMTDKQILVQKLIKEDKINIEEALLLLKEIEVKEKIVYIPQYPNGQWIDPFRRVINPYTITCYNER